MKDSLTLVIATVTLLLAWLYFSLVLLLGQSIGIYVDPGMIALSVPFVAVASWFVLRRLIEHRGRGRVLQICLATFFTVGSLLAADILYSFYLNSRTLGKPSLGDTRQFDPALAAGELLPRRYYPTEANFRLHKPEVTMSGQSYGGFYSPELLESPALAAFLEPHPFAFTINEHGLRNPTPLGRADLFALGDSFVFGWTVDEEASWVGRLQRLLDRPIYNLGVSGSSPKQELELLKYMIRTQGDSMHIDRLLWMLYEGNDLEDSYDERAPARTTEPERWETLADGTVLQGAARLPWLVQRQAIIHRIVTGQLFFRNPGPDEPDGTPYVIEGVESWFPLYRSATLGPRLFSPRLMEQASRTASYVLDHPNRPLLEAVFEEMAQLADEHAFEVTVLVVPTDVRLHGPHYENFPPISETPFLIDFITALSERHGFQAVDMLDLLKPYASSEMLYFRDDDHWNPRGHAVAAEIIRREVFPGE